MGKVIGCAGDFFRLRITRVDASDAPDLEWRDDILYREPPRVAVHEDESYALEAVSVDDPDEVSTIAVYGSSDEAHAALGAVEEDLEELTKSEFERRYLDG